MKFAISSVESLKDEQGEDTRVLFATWSVELDALKIKEDEETLSVPAVITKEAVYHYEDLDAYVYLPRGELENVAFTAQFAPVVERHPNFIVVAEPDEVRGKLTNLKVAEDRVRTNIVFFKNRCSPKYLEDIKTQKARSVSIGFFFEVRKESGEFEGTHYDFVKKNMFIDHLAAGNFEGKCPFPVCGIGLHSQDEATKTTETTNTTEATQGIKEKKEKIEKLGEAAKQEEKKVTNEKVQGSRSVQGLIAEVNSLVKQLRTLA